MRRFTWALLLGMLTLFGTAAAGREAVTLERMTYHGWPGSYRLTNGTIDLVFVPQIGRVMRYGYVGGPNVLWENAELLGKTVAPNASQEWVNYGGDKLWPAPAERWGGWPPDHHLDRGPHRVEVLPGNRLRVTGVVSPQLRLRFSREIALAPTGTGVTFRNTLINAGDKPVDWSIWEVAQVDDPDHCGLPLHRDGASQQGFAPHPGSPPVPETISSDSAAAYLRRHPTQGGKIYGASPQGRVWAELKGLRFEITAAYEAGLTYPDNGNWLHLWANPDPLKYMELELLSPIRSMEPGADTRFTTRWRLSKLPAP